METINISLPRCLKNFVEEQTSGEGYSSVSEYVRALIRKEQETALRIANQGKLIKAIEAFEVARKNSK